MPTATCTPRRCKDDGRAGEPVDLMQGLRADCPLPPFGGAEQYNWSPDGQEIAYTAKVVNNPAESTDSDIYVAAIDGSRPTVCLTPGMDGFDTDPTFAPNGAFIAFHSMRRDGLRSGQEPAHAVRSREQDHARSDGASSTRPRTAPPGCRTRRAWCSASEFRGCDQLFRVALADGAITQISRGWFDWGIRGVLPDGQTLLVDSQTMLRPHELSLLNVNDTTSRVVTHLNDQPLSALELPKVTERWVTASDGQLIHCWVIYPPDFDPHKKWPLITYCQGGPQSQVGQWFSYRWNFHLMAANGYVIVAPNRRGLPGFGTAWNEQISGDWGGQAMQDILAATDAMMVEPYIDTQRMAAVGASFGGYSVYWLMGHHQDRFRCMIAHAGVFNLESMYGATEEIWFSNWDLGGPYWQSPDSPAGVRSLLTAPLRRELAHAAVGRPWRKGLSDSRDAGDGSVHGRATQRRPLAVPVLPRRRPLGHEPAERRPLASRVLRLARSLLQAVVPDKPEAGYGSSRRTSANFSSAKTRSSCEWAAEICVRMRACRAAPPGTRSRSHRRPS